MQEEGEQPEQTAVREVHEETGLIARIAGKAGSFHYEDSGKYFHIQLYLMELTGGSEENSPEGRNWHWCSLEQAFTLLSFNADRKCLQNAFQHLQTIMGHP